MRVAVIGAGVSGLAVARLLGPSNEVIVFEKQDRIGGIAHVRMVDGIPYHTVGGHCLNSKNKKVMDFVHDLLPAGSWHGIRRAAKIHFRGQLIDYPIEFSLRQIAKIDRDLAFCMLRDFMSSVPDQNSGNLENWFISTFGSTMAEEYFIPYNRKIWARDPSVMSADWVQGKLPIPDKESVLKSLLGDVRDNMPHSYFYYPNANTQNAFIDALGSGINVRLACEVERIERRTGGWCVNGEGGFDLVISTAPLDRVISLLFDVPGKVKDAVGLLKYNKISNMLWETDEVDATWIYFPEPDIVFHRQIQIGSFVLPRKNCAITEAVGELSFAQMEMAGRKIPYLRRPVDYHVSDHAYVVFDGNHATSVGIVKEYLKSVGIHTLGRFGEWDYYNMDICIESAMDLAGLIESQAIQ